MSEITYLSDEALKRLYADKANNGTLVVDVREPDEYHREHIQGSKNIPLSALDKTDFSSETSRPVIFYCKLGSRTKSACQLLRATGFNKIYCLEGGIEQWKRCGLSVEGNKKSPLEIMRQMQIAVGSIILLGLLLSQVISTYFIVLPIIAGAGLLFAGITGYCGMAKLLMVMPWNTHKENVNV